MQVNNYVAAKVVYDNTEGLKEKEIVNKLYLNKLESIQDRPNMGIKRIIGMKEKRKLNSSENETIVRRKNRTISLVEGP